MVVAILASRFSSVCEPIAFVQSASHHPPSLSPSPPPFPPTEKSEEAAEVTERVITVSDSALAHLKDLRSKQGVDHLYLRMGVRSGGCSGMSYVLDVMKKEVRFRCCSPFSILPLSFR